MRGEGGRPHGSRPPAPWRSGWARGRHRPHGAVSSRFFSGTQRVWGRPTPCSVRHRPPGAAGWTWWRAMSSLMTVRRPGRCYLGSRWSSRVSCATAPWSSRSSTSTLRSPGRPGSRLWTSSPTPNAPGSRHAKRYQDVEELLRAGIDVYTTVNVQHIESLNDMVASITGVVVRERIPDRVFDDAGPCGARGHRARGPSRAPARGDASTMRTRLAAPRRTSSRWRTSPLCARLPSGAARTAPGALRRPHASSTTRLPHE